MAGRRKNADEWPLNYWELRLLSLLSHTLLYKLNTLKKSACISHVYVSKPSNSSVVGLVQFWHVNGFITLQLLCECICYPQSKRNKQKHLDMYGGELLSHLPRAPPAGNRAPILPGLGVAPSPLCIEGEGCQPPYPTPRPQQLTSDPGWANQRPS